jgi:hypothetical protein
MGNETWVGVSTGYRSTKCERDRSGREDVTYPAPPVMMQFLPSRRPMLNGSVDLSWACFKDFW